MPISVSEKNRPVALAAVIDTASAADTAIWYSSRPDASLTRLSPSSTATSRAGSGWRCRIAFAATASGGDTIAPSVKQAAHGSAGFTACTANATATVVNTTAPSASDAIDASSCRNSFHAV